MPSARRVALVTALASLVDDTGRHVGRLVAFSGAVLLAGTLVYALVPDGWQLVEDPLLSVAASVGTWLMGGFALGTLALFWVAYRKPQVGRYVGVLWDVGCFWPKAAHPLSPPSYGERAVPELADRVEQLVGAGGRVLLSGHSQGSVLTAATLLRVPAAALDHVTVITHGAPLRRLYARFFPAYLGASTLRAVDRLVGDRWRNLYRPTDPIGSWVLDADPAGGRVDVVLVDPPTLDDPLAGHAAYWGDPRYATSVDGLETGTAQRS